MATHSFTMLSWSIIFLILAVFGAILAFTGVAGAAMAGIGKMLFAVFIILLALSVISRWNNGTNTR